MPTRAPLKIKRHYSELSEKETNDVVGTVAELIVNFLKGKRESAGRAEAKPEQAYERDLEPRSDSR